MTETTSDVSTTQDPVALVVELKTLQAEVQTNDDPVKIRRIIEITRILRRTNTGPAKPKKAPAKKKSKELSDTDLGNLLDDIS